MKFESHWPRGSGGVKLLKQIIHDFLFLALAAIFFFRTVFAVLVDGHLSNIPMKFE